MPNGSWDANADWGDSESASREEMWEQMSDVSAHDGVKQVKEMLLKPTSIVDVSSLDAGIHLAGGRFVTSSLGFCSLLFLSVAFHCCRTGNNVGAAFGAFYLYVCIYIVTVQLLHKKCYFGDACWSGQQAAEMDAEQTEELFALNSHGILAILLLIPLSATCALYRLALDQSVGHCFLILFCLCALLAIFALIPGAVNKLQPKPWGLRESKPSLMQTIQGFLMELSLNASDMLAMASPEQWTFRPPVRALYIKATFWLLMAGIFTFMWTYSHQRRCMAHDALTMHTCNVACVLMEVFGTDLPQVPKDLDQ
eukprot:GGOE01013973.1.p1 GENE.GGOE01013973.1~~GGOE01013973.1.p1  ORF type:complete len:310 (-),score=54.68 GGOE01013973.1:119-1048(-)